MRGLNYRQYGYTWLDDHRVLAWTGDLRPSAVLLDTRSGARSPVARLSADLRASEAGPLGWVWGFLPTPDRKHIIWFGIDHAAGAVVGGFVQGWASAAANGAEDHQHQFARTSPPGMRMRLNDGQDVTWPPSFTPDGRQWVGLLMGWGGPTAGSLVAQFAPHFGYRGVQSRGSALPDWSRGLHYLALLGMVTDRDALIAPVAPISWPAGSAESQAWKHGTEFPLAIVDAVEWSRAPRSLMVRPPQGWSVLDYALSPNGHRICWVLRSAQAGRRKARPEAFEGVWVTDTAGANGAFVAQMPARPLNAGVPGIPERALQWLPDSSHISFVWRDDLYEVDVSPVAGEAAPGR